MLFHRNKEQKKFGTLIPAVVLSVVFGLAAGMVGMLVMLAYSPFFGDALNIGLGTSVSPAVRLQTGSMRADFTVKDLAHTMATIYRSEDVGSLVYSGQAIGGGVVLTSDGWILSHQSVLQGTQRLTGQGLSVRVNEQFYPVERVVVDSYSGAAFLHVAGASLPVAEFGKSDNLMAGELVFSLDAANGLRQANLVAVGSLPAADAVMAYRSSEDIQRVLRLSAAEGLVPGAALLAANGSAIGIYAGDSASGPYGIPINAISRQIGDVLRDGSIERPYLGVTFIDLSLQPNGGDVYRGALLKTYGQRAAVLWGSPAGKSGLRENDIIKAVNGEWVTVNNSLPDMLALYSPEESIRLTVIRDGQEMDYDLTLGAKSSK
jgi:serine protease Do